VPISFEAIHWPGCCWLTNWPEAAPPTFDIVVEELDMPDEPLPEAVDAAPEDEVEGVSDCPTVAEPDVPDPDWLMPDDPPDAAGFVPTVAPVLGCIADEPEVVDPDPVAAGRSVPPDGAGPV
jgi:hypothetical protein